MTETPAEQIAEFQSIALELLAQDKEELALMFFGFMGNVALNARISLNEQKVGEEAGQSFFPVYTAARH